MDTPALGRGRWWEFKFPIRRDRCGDFFCNKLQIR
jgi:hypothetical protein